jgi:hypothetical protein
LRFEVRSRKLDDSTERSFDQVNGLNGNNAVFNGKTGYAEVSASRLVSACEKQAFRLYVHKTMVKHQPIPTFRSVAPAKLTNIKGDWLDL